MSMESTQHIEIPDRYEFKYVVREEMVGDVRRAIQPFCELDRFAARSPQNEYAVQSLYLDTPNRDLFRMAGEQRAFRWKARVRTYAGADVVFLEVKNKEDDRVKKTRVRIPRRDWAERLHAPPARHACPAERLFRERTARHCLVPMLMVRYDREAWVSHVDKYARVTFDRRIVCQPWSEWGLDCDEAGWVALDGCRNTRAVPHAVVLELKCLTAVPRWISNLVGSLGLKRDRYSKYCRGIERFWARDALSILLNQL
jgi:SPX domain protein involved in polyphosphate accumulation